MPIPCSSTIGGPLPVRVCSSIGASLGLDSRARGDGGCGKRQWGGDEDEDEGIGGSHGRRNGARDRRRTARAGARGRADGRGRVGRSGEPGGAGLGPQHGRRGREHDRRARVQRRRVGARAVRLRGLVGVLGRPRRVPSSGSAPPPTRAAWPCSTRATRPSPAWSRSCRTRPAPRSRTSWSTRRSAQRTRHRGRGHPGLRRLALRHGLLPRPAGLRRHRPGLPDGARDDEHGLLHARPARARGPASGRSRPHASCTRSVPASEYADAASPSGRRDQQGKGDFRLIDVTNPALPYEVSNWGVHRNLGGPPAAGLGCDPDPEYGHSVEPSRRRQGGLGRLLGQRLHRARRLEPREPGLQGPHVLSGRMRTATGTRRNFDEGRKLLFAADEDFCKTSGSGTEKGFGYLRVYDYSIARCPEADRRVRDDERLREQGRQRRRLHDPQPAAVRHGPVRLVVHGRDPGASTRRTRATCARSPTSCRRRPTTRSSRRSAAR